MPIANKIPAAIIGATGIALGLEMKYLPKSKPTYFLMLATAAVGLAIAFSSRSVINAINRKDLDKNRTKMHDFSGLLQDKGTSNELTR